MLRMFGYDIFCLLLPDRICWSPHSISSQLPSFSLTMLQFKNPKIAHNNNLTLQKQPMEKKLKQNNHKTPLNDVMNLDDPTGNLQLMEQDLFVADLASQCTNLLQWVSDPNSQFFTESLWKNKMRIKASEKFPDLDSDQIRRLVDRDWRIMNESNKKKILVEYKTVPNPQELQSRAYSLKQKIEIAKSIK